ncbi:MAG: hypothetical protein U0794_09905, partial [Isosphaeraceae bacterium]
MERTIDAGSLAARTGYVPAPRPSHSRHGQFAALLCVLLATQAVGTTFAAEPEATEPRRAAAAAPSGPALLDLESLSTQAGVYARSLSAWYAATPPAERVTWGGLLAAAALGLGVIFERSIRLRPSRIVPGEFPTRFLERLQDGRLDRGKAQDYCELNPSPASRVALAAVRRWGRPVIDLDRAVGLAQRIEVERIRRHVGTLRRIAALAPLIGLLGT